MNINVRLEQEKDFPAVETLFREAFWNLYVEGCSEHLYARKIHLGDEYIPELSFVLTKDDEVIGAILTCHSKIKDHDKELTTISFGPVAIHPDYHRQGLGKLLISHAIEEAKKLGKNAITLGGYPYHYKIYGFESSKKYGISAPDGKYYVGFMILPLKDGILDDISGSICFPEVYNVTQEEVEEFDKAFPQRIKKHMPSQDEFAKACVLIDETEY